MTQQQTMKPVHTIPSENWLRAPATIDIMAALQDADAPPQALFVGGCVRNAVLGETVGDIDIATVHTPDETTRRLQAASIKAIPTGLDHGTITGVVEGKPFEITTLRKDVETDGRRAVVAFTTDWVEDAQRRDFTINTLLMDLDGHVYDPIGQGWQDLQNRRVVFVGDAAGRIAEDCLRILRFFRFYGTYGQGAPDAQALAACKEAADKIPTLSRERITQEFLKILALDNAVDILKIMFDNNVLKEFSLNFNYKNFISFCNVQIKSGFISISARLFLLAGLNIKNLQSFEKFLLLSKRFTKEIEAISKNIFTDFRSNDQKIKIALYKWGREATQQALLLWAMQGLYSDADLQKALALTTDWEIPVFPVSGDDLIREGFKPGPDLGRELARREEVWINNNFSDLAQ